jgi:D-xylose transport system permease protein
VADSEELSVTTENLSSAPDAVVGVGGDAELSQATATELPPELAAQSVGEYFAAWGRRLRNGESGALPVVAGLILVVIFFQLEQSQFLTSGNLVNLLVQSSVYIMFGVAELFALILSEIDLSIGFAGGAAAFIIAELNQPPVNLPWWIGVLAGIGFCAAVGAIQGTLITRLSLPSFIVTLAGFLAMEGVILELANVDPTALGGVINVPGASPVYKLASNEMSPALSWIVMIAAVAIFAVVTLRAAHNRRKLNLATPPIGVTILTIVITAIGGLVLVLICNANGGTPGVPWVVPFVLVVVLGWTVVLGRTRLGRYMYAIGANPEAARRAGINVAGVKTITFIVVGINAALAGLVYASRLGSISTDVDGGNQVLYAVAAAVIGGASLFGGRGKPLNALLGGLVIAVVFNGLGLMGVSAAITDLLLAAVLIAAVTLDSLVRRRATAR